MNKLQKQQYYKLYYIKHKEHILKQKADIREANRLYENQIREIHVVILDRKDGNKKRE
jgi:hypothetical protein